MNNILNNILCKCGHRKMEHVEVEWMGGPKELICRIEKGDSHIYHSCIFEQDNLSFLEWKLEQKQLA
jgi:hypothetical protein